MEPRTILHITPSVRLLGARKSLLSLVANLDRRRWRPVVACPSQGALTRELTERGIEWRTFTYDSWRKGRTWPKIPFILWQLIRIIRRERVDLIHCNEIYPNPFAVIAKKFVKIPVVTHMRLSVTPRMIEKYFLHRANRIVVVSEAAGRDFDHWPDKAQRVRVAYNGVDLEDFPCGFDRAAVRRELGVADDAIVVGHAGLLSERKRQHITLAAAQRAIAQEPRLHFLIVGDASLHTRGYEARLRNDAKNLGLGEKVTFVPFTRNIARIYATLDLNLLISDDEGFGRVIVEAAAYNVPSIGTRIGGIPEVIKPGVTGELIELDDVDALAKFIAQLARDESRRKSLGEAANKLLLEKFTIAKHVETMDHVFTETLAR